MTRSRRPSKRHRGAIFETLEGRRLLSAGTLPGVWKPTAAAPAAFQTTEMKTFALDAAQLQSAVATAPPEFTSAPALEIVLPDPKGNLARFAIVESPVMAAELAAKFPEIRTYSGQGIDDPTATLRLDITPAGLHAQVLSSSGRYYIDPFSHSTGPLYASYRVDGSFSPFRTTAVTDGGESAFEAVHRQDPWSLVSERSNLQAAKGRDGDIQITRSGTELRVFRTAIAAVGEYTAYHGGTVADGMAAVVTTINRITGIFETELSIRLELIANNERLIYTNPAADPYTNGNANSMLDENQANLDNLGVLGSANYDLGHVFATQGSGLATLGSAGIDGIKARGVSAIRNPTGDGYSVDFVAHEMGHQFGAGHTWNGDSGSCTSGQHDAVAAYEPGSGSTILAYAGICGNDNLQATVDPFFHSVSFDEIIGHVDNTIPSVGSRTPTGNSVPVVDAGSEFTIPARTPFALTATGSDDDAADVLTYSWEQRDLGPQQDVSLPDNGSSPLFRAWPPAESPTRVFPRLSDLLSNTTVVGETLPTTTRDLNFRATVRDNRAGGGGVNSDDTVVHVVNTGTPFRVTSHNSASSLPALSSQSVTWNVAGTTANGINTANVNIRLSIDGGLTYPITLAEGTPNDGRESVTLPQVNAARARIKVEGADNVFFDVTDQNFTIANDELAPFVRLEPLGGVAFVSDTSGFLDSGADVQEFSLFVEEGQTISAVLEPLSDVSVSMELLGQSTTVTSPRDGESAVLPPQQITTSGTYMLRVSGAGATGYSLRLVRNGALEDPNGDGPRGSQLDIGNSLIPLGSGRYAVLGRLSPSPVHAEILQFNDPSLFVDISGSGTSLNLTDEGTQSITTVVGNSMLPSGVVTVGNNGALAPGLLNLPFVNDELPSSLFETALVPFWDDLSGAAGDVLWEERLVGGINTLIVQWENRPHFDFGGGVTFQVQVFESGPVLARFVYEDVSFGDPRGDEGASATIGYQENSSSALEFSKNVASLASGDVLEFIMIDTSESDEYQVDLVGSVPIDVVVASTAGSDLSGQTVQLLAPDGTTVLATGVPDPVQTNVDATNFDLGILGFQVPADGTYTIRLIANVLSDYTVIVAESVTLDTEPNDVASGALRPFDATGAALGFVSAVGAADEFDFYEHFFQAGQTVTLTTDTVFDDPSTLPINDLDPELQVIHPDGTTIVSSDLDSAGDDKNAFVSFTAPQTGIYRVRVGATSGAGEYLLSRIAELPSVMLSVDNTSIAEASGESTLTATLSEAATIPVIVELALSGTATFAQDYTTSSTQIEIAVGATSGSLSVMTVQDSVDEPDETVIFDVVDVVGGTEFETQQQTITIVDDDDPPSFSVASLEPGESGFRIAFNDIVDSSDLNLYDTRSAARGPADVVVIGATTGPVTGSLNVEESAISFIKSGAPLEADTYTVTLRSADNGFKDAAGALLDGDGDGTAGDDYVGSFTIEAAPDGARTIQIPDFVRGPGQAVHLPAGSAAGIPISISDGDNVRAVDLRVRYDPSLLTITDASAPAGGTVVLNNTTPGLAILVYFNSNPLSAGESTIIEIEASIPTDNATESYGKQHILDVHEVIVGDGSDNEFPVIVDDAVHLASYLSDVSGNGRTNAADASQVARFAALIDRGFVGALNTDPTLVGDISGNGRINAADAALVARFAALIEVPQIPDIPVGVLTAGARGAEVGPGLFDVIPVPFTAPTKDNPPAPIAGDISGSPSGLAPYPASLPAVDQAVFELSRSAVGDAELLSLSLEEAVDELLSHP